MSTIAVQQEHLIPKIAFRHILVATDFSALSRRALDYALLIAHRYDSQLSLVHAIAPAPIDSIPLEALTAEVHREHCEAEREMGRLVSDTSFGQIQPKIHVKLGDAAGVIAAVAECGGADLLVLGTRGRGVFKHLMVGSVAERVLRDVQCPVLTVGSHALPRLSDREVFQSILFATDFGHACISAVQLAISLAADCAARLTLLHTVPTMSAVDLGYGYAAASASDLVAYEKCAKSESLKRLKELVPANCGLCSPPEFVTDTSLLPEGILEAAKLRNADLIVMGANRTKHPRLASHIPWSVVHEVLCRAECPVLTTNC